MRHVDFSNLSLYGPVVELRIQTAQLHIPTVLKLLEVKVENLLVLDNE